jgi:hypothetical protein
MATGPLLIYTYFASMLKLGIFGDQFTLPEPLERLKTIAETEVAGIYLSGNANPPVGFVSFSSPIELMDISDAILILSDKSISNELIKLILRKSKHVFLKSIPNLTVREIKELIDLGKEAGIVTFIYNPFSYLPFLDPFKNNYEKPLLINLRTCFDGTLLKPSHEMLLLVTALNQVVQSNYKKLDVVGLKDSGKQITVNLRIEYDNGSIVNLTISEEKLPGNCEIFSSKGTSRFEFQTPLYISYPQLNQEYTAIGNFVQLIRNQDNRSDSFDNFLNGVQIVHEIRKNLRYNEIDF